eukprot:m.240230 g.240230  ORF g.240230 m.240230 type:complete len:522 (+) comp33763_c3_seq3:95-1660(+)
MLFQGGAVLCMLVLVGIVHTCTAAQYGVVPVLETNDPENADAFAQAMVTWKCEYNTLAGLFFSDCSSTPIAEKGWRVANPLNEKCAFQLNPKTIQPNTVCNGYGVLTAQTDPAPLVPIISPSIDVSAYSKIEIAMEVAFEVRSDFETNFTIQLFDDALDEIPYGTNYTMDPASIFVTQGRFDDRIYRSMVFEVDVTSLAELRFGVTRTWSTVGIFMTNISVTTIVTASPTVSPTTSSPTTSPTKSPSTSPTTSPTISPTSSSPTSVPTTSSPTTAPSTSLPTVSPSTSSPSTSPISSAPSKPPTVQPSVSPTVPAAASASSNSVGGIVGGVVVVIIIIVLLVVVFVIREKQFKKKIIARYKREEMVGVATSSAHTANETFTSRELASDLPVNTSAEYEEYAMDSNNPAYGSLDGSQAVYDQSKNNNTNDGQTTNSKPIYHSLQTAEVSKNVSGSKNSNQAYGSLAVGGLNAVYGQTQSNSNNQMSDGTAAGQYARLSSFGDHGHIEVKDYYDHVPDRDSGI